MQVAVTPQVEEAIQNALRFESTTTLRITTLNSDNPLTVNDARCIIECLENPRFDTLAIANYDIHNPAVLNVFRDGLPLCTSVTTVSLFGTQLGNEGLQRLLPAFCNTSITDLHLYRNNIQGRRGCEVLRDLLRGNNTLVEVDLRLNPIGPEGVSGFGQGLAGNHGLQSVNLESCQIGNDGLANLLRADGMNNNSLKHLNLSWNSIEGEEGGGKLTLLLQRCPALQYLQLNWNSLGPLGARALAPGLAAAGQLERLEISHCGLGNDGVANLVPDGQVNRSLTSFDVCHNNTQGLVGEENVIALASRCTNLDSLSLDESILSLDQRRRLDLLLDRKRLCTAAQALGGSPFSLLFRAVEKAHRHEHGLSAIFVILQNDGEDYFHTALNREIE